MAKLIRRPARCEATAPQTGSSRRVGDRLTQACPSSRSAGASAWHGSPPASRCRRCSRAPSSASSACPNAGSGKWSAAWPSSGAPAERRVVSCGRLPDAVWWHPTRRSGLPRPPPPDQAFTALPLVSECRRRLRRGPLGMTWPPDEDCATGTGARSPWSLASSPSVRTWMPNSPASTAARCIQRTAFHAGDPARPGGRSTCHCPSGQCPRSATSRCAGPRARPRPVPCPQGTPDRTGSGRWLGSPR
jgi:hypothetical protein